MKIADEVEVDVSRQAWQVRYADAIATAEAVTIEGSSGILVADRGEGGRRLGR